MLKSAARKALWLVKGMALFGGAVVTLFIDNLWTVTFTGDTEIRVAATCADFPPLR